MMTVLRIIELPPARRDFHGSFETLNLVLWWMVGLILVFGPLLLVIYQQSVLGTAGS